MVVNPESNWRHIHSILSGSRDQFLSCLKDSRHIQNQQLSRILQQNAGTLFGRQYEFSKIDSYAKYSEAVPLQTYEDLLPFLQAQAADHNAAVVCFEETGGSSQGKKQIPYTSQSLSAFQQALFPWLDDLLLARPAIKQGSAYWSISPAFRDHRTTTGGHPIGLQDDALYFGEELAGHIMGTLAVSPAVAACTDVSTWQYQTLLSLLRADDLTFISIWSPDFLLELLRQSKNIIGQLLDELARQNPARAKNINKAFEYDQIDTQCIWPKLDTISCWTDGGSSGFLPALKNLFPHAHIQGKGLLATEGVASIPLATMEAPVLAVNSGFFEFLGDDSKVRRSHELQQGECYELVLTNDSGLYRYRLGDRIEIKGHCFVVPVFSFIGRGDRVSDICGEKLTEAFVADVLSGTEGFATLLPVQSTSSHYVLVTSNTEIDAGDIDHLLSQNPQYQYARTLGQLGEIRKLLVPDAMQRYVDFRLSKGQRLGDIKPPRLETDISALEALTSTA